MSTAQRLPCTCEAEMPVSARGWAGEIVLPTDATTTCAGAARHRSRLRAILAGQKVASRPAQRARESLVLMAVVVAGVRVARVAVAVALGASAVFNLDRRMENVEM